MSTTQWAQLNIGRNLGRAANHLKDMPMSDEAWARFKDAARMRLALSMLDRDGKPIINPDAASFAAEHLTETHEGTGVWDGVPEDSARISLYCEDGLDIGLLQRMAGPLAREYMQDAVAVVSDSYLAEPSN